MIKQETLALVGLAALAAFGAVALLLQSFFVFTIASPIVMGALTVVAVADYFARLNGKPIIIKKEQNR